MGFAYLSFIAQSRVFHTSICVCLISYRIEVVGHMLMLWELWVPTAKVLTVGQTKLVLSVLQEEAYVICVHL